MEGVASSGAEEKQTSRPISIACISEKPRGPDIDLAFSYLRILSAIVEVFCYCCFGRISLMKLAVHVGEM